MRQRLRIIEVLGAVLMVSAIVAFAYVAPVYGAKLHDPLVAGGFLFAASTTGWLLMRFEVKAEQRILSMREAVEESPTVVALVLGFYRVAWVSVVGVSVAIICVVLGVKLNLEGLVGLGYGGIGAGFLATALHEGFTLRRLGQLCPGV